MKLLLKRLLAIICAILSASIVVAKPILYFIGISTAPEDAMVLNKKLKPIYDFVQSQPDWLPWALFTILVVYVFMVERGLTWGVLKNNPKEKRFYELSTSISRVTEMHWENIKSTDDFVHNNTRMETNILYTNLKKIGITTPDYSVEDYVSYNLGNASYLDTLLVFAKLGALKEAKKEVPIQIKTFKQGLIEANDNNT